MFLANEIKQLGNCEEAKQFDCVLSIQEWPTLTATISQIDHWAPTRIAHITSGKLNNLLLTIWLPL